jgi:hypothetical protein
MDDFVILAQAKSELWEILGKIKDFLTAHLKLQLNPIRVAVLPVERGIDCLGYVIYPDGYKRIRRRNVVNFRRRLKALENKHAQAEIAFDHARQSIASWLGLAKHASAFHLSRALFLEHDVRNIGKRLLVRGLSVKAVETQSFGEKGVGACLGVDPDPKQRRAKAHGHTSHLAL